MLRRRISYLSDHKSTHVFYLKKLESKLPRGYRLLNASSPVLEPNYRVESKHSNMQHSYMRSAHWNANAWSVSLAAFEGVACSNNFSCNS